MRNTIVRLALFSVLLPIAACTDNAVTDELLPATTIELEVPAFTVQPGAEKFYCYYTTLPTSRAVGVHHIKSQMTGGSHHMIVFKTKAPVAPDGTLVECEDFGMEGTQDMPVWLYASQQSDDGIAMPDGVGMALEAEQPVIVNMHYVNTGDAPLDVSVKVQLETYDTATSYEEAHVYYTFNSQISIPPGATGSASGSCDVPPDAKFIAMSTHSHRYTMSARVTDGDAMVVETLDWEHAAVKQWDAPHFSFASGKLNYRCDYLNTGTQPITVGESAVANEMCMAVGVYYPATSDTFCLNSSVIAL